MIAWLLTKLPILAVAGRFIKGNCLLVTGWVILGCLLIVGGMTFSLWSKAKLNEINLEKTRTALVQAQAETESLKRSVNEAVAANSDLANSLKNLSELQANTDRIVNKLVLDVLQGKKDAERIRQSIKELEESNGEVKKYLDSRTPIDLSCLRTNTCKDTAANSGNKDRANKTKTAFGIADRIGSHTCIPYHYEPRTGGRMVGRCFFL